MGIATSSLSQECSQAFVRLSHIVVASSQAKEIEFEVWLLQLSHDVILSDWPIVVTSIQVYLLHLPDPSVLSDCRSSVVTTSQKSEVNIRVYLYSDLLRDVLKAFVRMLGLQVDFRPSFFLQMKCAFRVDSLHTFTNFVS